MPRKEEEPKKQTKSYDTKGKERYQPSDVFQMQGTRPLCKQLSRKDGEQVKQVYEGSQPWPMNQEWKPRTPCKNLLREIFPRIPRRTMCNFCLKIFKGGSTLVV